MSSSACRLLVVGWVVATPLAAAQEQLISRGTTWRYFDNGTDPGPAWLSPELDDSPWPSGPRRLAYGGNENTTISFGPDPLQRHMTSYFRARFDVLYPTIYAGLELRLLRDDGAAVYLNGVAIQRDNLPAGPLGPGSTASGSITGYKQDFYYPTFLHARDLVIGTNTLAVELYQDSALGADAAFDLALIEHTGPSVIRGPYWSTRGNHELDGANDNDTFTIPTAGAAGGVPSNTEAYYSFDWANVHFVCLDSFGSDRAAGGDIWRWAKLDLAATTQDWIIAFWHDAPYSRGSRNSDVEIPMKEMRRNFLPLLEDYGVSLVLGGHSHSDERTGQELDGVTLIDPVAATTFCDAPVGGQGCLAALKAQGQPSLSSGLPFRFAAEDLRTESLGLLLYSLSAESRPGPFRGRLCLGSGTRRTAPQNSGASVPCTGPFELDFEPLWQSPARGGLSPRTTVYRLVWHRSSGTAMRGPKAARSRRA